MMALSLLLVPVFGSACLASVWDLDISVKNGYVCTATHFFLSRARLTSNDRGLFNGT